MAIPDSILNKPGKLTPEEVTIMREHCYLGYKLVQRIPVLKEAAEIVYSHQERFDGTGYPNGLRGDAIPLGSRIFSVADTLDAITSDRPYRPKQSMGAARAEIQRCTGTQFDPDVVSVFQQMPDEIFEELRRAIGAQSDPLAYSAGAKE